MFQSTWLLRVLFTDLMIKKVLLKLWHRQQIWACQLRFSVMCIPKNFTSGIYLTSVFRNRMRGLKGGFERQRWNDIAAALVIFIKRSFLRNQFSNCFMTKDNLVGRASSFLSTTNAFVSFACRINFAPWIFNGRSLIYITNKRCPKIEPCGTP